MTSQMSTKIRLVRCPRCENVLPEWPNIPLYQCGGCGAVLRAKNRRNDTSNSEPSPHQTSSSQDNENETHPGRSGQKATTAYLETSPEKPSDLNASDEILGSTGLCSLGNDKLCLEDEESTEQDEHKSSLGQDDRKYGNMALGHNRDQSAGNNSVDELPCSHELRFHENEESSAVNREPLEQEEDGHSLDNAGEYKNESRDGCREGNGDRKFSAELPSSSRLICHTIETSSLGGTANDKLDKENNILEQYEKRDQDEFRVRQGESLKGPGDLTSSDELLGSTKLCSLGNDKLCLEDKESVEQNEHRSSLGQDDGTYGNMALDHNNDQWGERNSFGEELPYPYELSFRQNDESSPQTREPSKQDEGEHSLKNAGESKNEYQDGHSEEIGDRTLPAELRRSDSFTFHAVKASSSGCTGCDKLEKKNDTLEQRDRRDQDEHRDQKGESLDVNIFLATVLPLHVGTYHQSELSAGGRAEREGGESRFLPQQNNDKNQHNFAGRVGFSSNDASFSREASTSTVVAFHKVEKSSVEVKAFINMDTDQMSNFKSLDVGSFTPKRGQAIVADRTPLSESILPENLFCNNRDLEQSQNEVQGIDHASYLDASESPTLHPRPELGTLSNSHTRDFSDCDASVSSYEGTDDQFFKQYSPLRERKFKATGFTSTNKSSRTNRYGINKLQNRGLDVQRQGTDFSSTSRGETRGITGGNSILQESPELRRHDRAIQSRTRLDKHEHGSRMPYNPRSSQFIPRDRSLSNYPHVHQQQPGFSPPDMTSSQEPVKRQLLRIVRELEEKIKQANISRGPTNGKSFAGNLGKKKHTPIHHDDLATEAHAYADFRVSRYPRQSKISRMAFPGEAAHCRHQVDCLCSCCCHTDRQCTAQLSSHSIHCCKCQYMTHPIHSCRNAFPSCSSHPQAYISSKSSPQGRVTKANYGKHKEHAPKSLYVREKQNLAKQRLMPVAGGSPIIACSHCSELLQLPWDFPLFRRRYHHLRCNSCKRILKFSLRKGSHLVPYAVDAPAPPPSRDG